MTDINLINAEVLRVAPDEVLIIKFNETELEDPEGLFDHMNEILRTVGLERRSFILQGDIDLAVAKQDKPLPGIAPDYADSAE